MKICKLYEDEIWNIFFECYFKIYCSYDIFKIFLDSNMTWKTLCREIFQFNINDPYLHQVVCKSCFSTHEIKNCATSIQLKPSKARLDLIRKTSADDESSCESSSDNELHKIRQCLSDESLHSGEFFERFLILRFINKYLHSCSKR